MRGPPAVAEQWHCVPVSPASSGPAGRRGFSKQSGGPFARFDSRRITIFKPGTNFRAEALAETTEEGFDKVFAINTRGLAFTVKKALPLLNDGGAHILVTSVTGNQGLPRFPAFNAPHA